ncbi:MAG: response regulator [Gammaproteobacteria bacterium]|nr:response regulator [Gammaproteobacteria bacterium]
MAKDDIAILLVEDDDVDVMNVQRAFKRNNVLNPLHVARNGLEALDMLRTPGMLNPYPKIILLDINMPKMNGLEFLEEVRKDEELKKLSVFVLTTSNADRDRVEAYNLNVAGYIIKPVEMDNFLNAISSLHMYWKLIELP